MNDALHIGGAGKYDFAGSGGSGFFLTENFSDVYSKDLVILCFVPKSDRSQVANGGYGTEYLYRDIECLHGSHLISVCLFLQTEPGRKPAVAAAAL